ncbi:MAG TPA: hypothetical protein EYQ00_04065 [Dehalococcoidia bacterium]|nr:hypothetical protein [Dehalococcoidia bacterium]
MLLDDMEKQIECHRRKALELVEERSKLETKLRILINYSSPSYGDNDEVTLSEVDLAECTATVDRLKRRLAAIHVDVTVSRDTAQCNALEEVNATIRDLIEMVETSSPMALTTAESYLNACSNGTGSRFEALMLSCTSDDQKRVKEQIKSIIDNGIKSNGSSKEKKVNSN